MCNLKLRWWLLHWQCERNAVFIRMKLLTKREYWLVQSKRKEEAAVAERASKIEEKTRVCLRNGKNWSPTRSSCL